MAIIRTNFYPGTTSALLRVPILNSSVTTGAGLTGLVFNSTGLIAYYIRDGQNTATAISLAAGTLGTWSSGGFIEVDATHMPGIYEIGIPNAVIASGVKKATIQLSGATNMQQTTIDIDMVETGDPYAALVTTTYGESAAVPSATATLKDKLVWMATVARNKITNTVSTMTLYADDNTTSVAASTVSDDGTTATRGKFV
jgi:hypothetical protein